MNRKGKILLVVALVVVVGMAFRVSWNALRDVACAIGADHTAATLYPFVVDGLMALALIATLVLTNEKDKRTALRVLATYTLASLVLNYVHGLVPELHGASVDWGRLADWDSANYVLVLLATSLPVGSIYFGSDLVAKVLHHRPASANELAGGQRADEPAHLPHADALSTEAGPLDAPADPQPSAAPVASGLVGESEGSVRGRFRTARTRSAHRNRMRRKRQPVRLSSRKRNWSGCGRTRAVRTPNPHRRSARCPPVRWVRRTA